MFLYGSKDFTWADFGNVSDGNEVKTNNINGGTTKDNSIAPKPVPQTGENYVLVGLVGIIVVSSLISLISFKKNRDIK